METYETTVLLRRVRHCVTTIAVGVSDDSRHSGLHRYDHAVVTSGGGC